jgi:hypothetical protein
VEASQPRDEGGRGGLAEEMRGDRQTSRNWAERKTGRKGRKKMKKEKNFPFIFRIYFREENYLEIAR